MALKFSPSIASLIITGGIKNGFYLVMAAASHYTQALNQQLLKSLLTRHDTMQLLQIHCGLAVGLHLQQRVTRYTHQQSVPQFNTHV